MKESAFRTSVLNKVPAWVHRQPNPATFMGMSGTPDHYFDFHSDLWVEWKIFSTDDHLPAFINPTKLLSPAQTRWLNRRWDAGRNAVVVAGVKLRARAHGVVLASPDEWSTPLPREKYEPLLAPSADLAKYITERVSRRTHEWPST